MTLHGFSGMLRFLSILKKLNFQYKLEQQRDECIMVTFATPGFRYEVEIFEDHIEYSIFTGDEHVSFDEKKLIRILINDKNNIDI